VIVLSLAVLPRAAEAPRDPVTARTSGPLFPPALVWLLDARERDEWQKPGMLVAALDLRPGAAVADIGAGSGYMMSYLSRAVGPRGRVYAQEIQPGMLRLLAERAARHDNVVVCRGGESDPGLAPASIDRALLLTAYHEMAAPVALLARLRAAMRPGGRLLIVDWNDFAAGGAEGTPGRVLDGARFRAVQRPGRTGTPAVTPEERVPEAVVCREAARAGWRPLRRHDFLPYQYCLEFARTGE
jgi:SAM-dependent methyltransferase